MELSDDDLRKELAKYMDSVPPVTGSTRQVLRAKLAKFQAAQPTEPSVQNNVPENVEKPTEKRKRQTLASSTNTTVTKKVVVETYSEEPPMRQRSPEKKRTAETPAKQRSEADTSVNLNKSRNTSVLYEDNEYRVRYFPPTELPDYPGGVPVFRRRSLHPAGNQDKISDPYEEFYVRSPRLQAKIDAERIISRVMTGTSSTTTTYRNNVDLNHCYWRKPPTSRLSWLRPLLDFFSYILMGLCSLLLAPFMLSRMVFSRVRSAMNVKTCFYFLLICILIALVIFFVFSDPFYRNPVAEFADRISGPLASFLQLEEN